MKPTRIWDCPREIPDRVEVGTVVAWKGRLYECVLLREVQGDCSGSWGPERWPQAYDLEGKYADAICHPDKIHRREYDPSYQGDWLCWVPWNGPRPTITDEQATKFYADALSNYLLACRAVGLTSPDFSAQCGIKVDREAREKIAEILKDRVDDGSGRG